MAHIVDICWCRRLRPGRPLDHCLNQSKIPSCDTLVARCLAVKVKIYEERGEIESESIKKIGWNSERPRKTSGLCCLIIARELPRGTHLPWVPTLCTDKLYKM